MAESKICPSCKERNNPSFTHCWKCGAGLGQDNPNTFTQEKRQGELIPIPRVESKAPNKNTVEWEIPGKVSVGLMRIERIGYMIFAKVKVEKKYWWDQGWKNSSVRESDAGMAVLKMLPFLEQHGYTIGHNSVQFGEKIGDPEYFLKLTTETFDAPIGKQIQEDEMKELLEANAKLIPDNVQMIEERAMWLAFACIGACRDAYHNFVKEFQPKELLVDPQRQNEIHFCYEMVICSMSTAIKMMREKLQQMNFEDQSVDKKILVESCQEKIWMILSKSFGIADKQQLISDVMGYTSAKDKEQLFLKRAKTIIQSVPDYEFIRFAKLQVVMMGGMICLDAFAAVDQNQITEQVKNGLKGLESL